MFKIGGIYYDSKMKRYIIPIKQIGQNYFGISNINEKNNNHAINEILRQNLLLYNEQSFWWYKHEQLKAFTNGYLGQIDENLLMKFETLCEKSTNYQLYMKKLYMKI